LQIRTFDFRKRRPVYAVKPNSKKGTVITKQAILEILKTHKAFETGT